MDRVDVELKIGSWVALSFATRPLKRADVSKVTEATDPRNTAPQWNSIPSEIDATETPGPVLGSDATLEEQIFQGSTHVWVIEAEIQCCTNLTNGWELIWAAVITRII